MLRNFPHQINQLDKLHAVLACVADLIDAGQDPFDDGILGYECARRGVYTFRGLSNPSQQQLEQRILDEQTKPASKQGARTFARELRRTLDFMGLLEIDGTAIRVSPIGERLLRFAPESNDYEYILLWREAIMRITLPPAHQRQRHLRPAPLMLRLVQQNPGIATIWLLLGLEARDNSDREFRRIQDLINSRNLTQVLRQIGTTQHQARNAVKIIPAVLRRAGLLEIKGGVCQLTRAGEEFLQGQAGVFTTAIPRIPGRTRRRTTRPPQPNVTRPEDIRVPPPRRKSTISPEAMSLALDNLGIRTQAHQRLLQRLVANLRNVSDVSATEDRYDLYVRSSMREAWILFEVKTGIPSLAQARQALGQLCQYEFLDIRPHLRPGSKVLRVVVFAEEPGEMVRSFLDAYDVLVVVRSAGAFVVPPELTDYFSTPASRTPA